MAEMEAKPRLEDRMRKEFAVLKDFGKDDKIIFAYFAHAHWCRTRETFPDSSAFTRYVTEVCCAKWVGSPRLVALFYSDHFHLTSNLCRARWSAKESELIVDDYEAWDSLLEICTKSDPQDSKDQAPQDSQKIRLCTS